MGKSGKKCNSSVTFRHGAAFISELHLLSPGLARTQATSRHSMLRISCQGGECKCSSSCSRDERYLETRAAVALCLCIEPQPGQSVASASTERIPEGGGFPGTPGSQTCLHVSLRRRYTPPAEQQAVAYTLLSSERARQSCTAGHEVNSKQLRIVRRRSEPRCRSGKRYTTQAKACTGAAGVAFAQGSCLPEKRSRMGFLPTEEWPSCRL